MANRRKENVFYDILEQRNVSLGYKNKNFKTTKNWLFFLKGLTHGFWSKNSHLFKIFFRQYRQGKCLLRYSGTKKHLSRLQKQKSSKSRKINVFPNWITHGFGPKMTIFPNFFFRHYRPGKCLLRYSRTKKTTILGYKNKKFKKSKNWHFSKGVNQWFLSKNGHFSNFFFRQYETGKYLLRYSRTKKRLSRL